MKFFNLSVLLFVLTLFVNQANSFELSDQFVKNVNNPTLEWVPFTYDKDQSTYSFAPTQFQFQSDNSLLFPYQIKSKWFWKKPTVGWIRIKCSDNEIFDLGSYDGRTFEKQLKAETDSFAQTAKTFFCPVESDNGKNILAFVSEQLRDSNIIYLKGIYPSDLIFKNKEKIVELQSYLFEFQDGRVVTKQSTSFSVDCLNYTLKDIFSDSFVNLRTENSTQYLYLIDLVCLGNTNLKIAGYDLNENTFKFLRINEQSIEAQIDSPTSQEMTNQTIFIYAYGMSIEERDNVLKVLELSAEFKTTIQINDVLLSVRNGVAKIKLKSLEDLEKYIASQKKSDLIQFDVLRNEEEMVRSVMVKPVTEIKASREVQIKPLPQSKDLDYYTSQSKALSNQLSYEEIKCKELGFKSKTNKFKDCISKLKLTANATESIKNNQLSPVIQAIKGDGSNDDVICQKYGFDVGTEFYKNCRLELKLAEDKAKDQFRQYELQQSAYQEQFRQYEEQNRIREDAIEAARQ